MSQHQLSHETVTESPKVVCLAIGGELDHSNGQEAEAYFDDLWQKESPRHLLLDLSELTFAGSVFFSTLLFWRETVTSGGGKLVVIAPTSEVLSTMRLFTIDRMLTICPDRETAEAEVAES